ncbi:sialidase family protein [Corynebacterium uterequi]|uniref:exo-alpha-sialidase n=1 Tax=Corynebacterium uterequi TaxID=1072256 RepID=A0A0G3HDG7_9CORY|nr:sialidase family protein [Corynebacterium uterequi]AKK10740.1 putative Ig domain-containing protein [Corynebacterium uterequi]
MIVRHMTRRAATMSLVSALMVMSSGAAFVPVHAEESAAAATSQPAVDQPAATPVSETPIAAPPTEEPAATSAPTEPAATPEATSPAEENPEANEPAADAEKDVSASISGSVVETKPGAWELGETIGFTVSVKNTTDTPRAIKVVESNLSNYNGCRWGSVAPGETKTCTASHTVDATDVAAGSFTPSVTVDVYAKPYYQGQSQRLAPLTGPAVNVVVPTVEITKLAVADAEGTTYKPGHTLHLDATLHNPSGGEVSITVAEESDITGTCAAPTLGAGQDTTCALSYAVTAEDIELGEAELTLTVTGGDYSDTKTVIVPVLGNWAPATAFAPHNANPASPARLTPLQVLDAPTGEYNIRIPALTTASNGDVLASYDLRPKKGGSNNGGDAPNTNWIVQRRSTDNGTTWGPRTVIARGGFGEDGKTPTGYSDPSYVVDHETGTIFNFHVYSQQTGVVVNNPYYEYGADGRINEKNPKTMNFNVAVSKDNGRSWTKRVITADVLGEKGREVQSCFATSGAGTQKMAQPHKGRLLQQAACFKKGGKQVVALTIYSDDHGATWHSGEFTSLTADAPQGGSWQFDENKVVELSDGTLLLNSRTPSGAAKGHRIVATSTDGGQTWQDYRVDTGVIDPANNAQVIRAFPTARPGTLRSKVLLFSNTKNVKDRTNGTISLSYDDGTTWPVAKEFRAQGTGYTTMTIQADGSIGILYEPDIWSKVGYQNFTLSWLEPKLATEPAFTSVEGSITDGVEVSLKLAMTGDDPALKNTVTVTGLPKGLSFNAETMTITGRTALGNTEPKVFPLTVAFSEEDDGTGIPRAAKADYTLTVNKNVGDSVTPKPEEQKPGDGQAAPSPKPNQDSDQGSQGQQKPDNTNPEPAGSSTDAAGIAGVIAKVLGFFGDVLKSILSIFG